MRFVLHFMCRWLGLPIILALATTQPSQAAQWFWKVVPAAKADGSRAGALRVIRMARARGRRLFGSRPMLTRVVGRWRPQIEAAARHGRISEALIVAVIMAESGGNPRARSPAGARGLGQLMPATARRYGVRNVYNGGQNLKGSAAYLSDLISLFKGDLVLVLAAYNAGEAAVERYKGVPPYRETRAYVTRVLSAFDLAGRLCSRPPRAARRRCRFRLRQPRGPRRRRARRR